MRLESPDSPGPHCVARRRGRASNRRKHDRERRHLEWGSEGPDNYHGYLDVTGDGATASVTVFLHTERAGSGDIDRGIAGTLTATKQLAEAGPAPGPAS